MNPSIYTLYVITDHTWLNGTPLKEAVRKAIQGGATIVQIREKNIDTETYIQRAQEVKEVCDDFHIPLIINDHVLVAKAVGAGVHLGASDGDIASARATLGSDAIIGATAKTIDAAKAAEAAGANYLGSGAVFGSTTKTDAKNLSIAQFSAICAAVSIPVVAIGGVNEENAHLLKGAGMAGLCAISAVFSKPDVQEAAKRMRLIAEEVCL